MNRLNISTFNVETILKGRDPKNPVQAAKLIHEVTQTYSGDREMCLQVLAQVFRDCADVLETVNSHVRFFPKNGKSLWEQEAANRRQYRALKLESDPQAAMRMVLSSPIAKRLIFENKEPDPARDPAYDATVVENKMDDLLQEQGRYLADKDMQHFTEEEEQLARQAVAERGDPWDGCVFQILQRALHEENPNFLPNAIDQICSKTLREIKRESATCLEFAQKLEKQLSFAEWLCSFTPTEYDSAMRRHRADAYSAFERGLRAHEKSAWTYIDTRMPNPLAAVLQKLREKAYDGEEEIAPPTVPVLAAVHPSRQENIKSQPVKRSKGEESESEEEKPKRRQVKGKPVAVAEIEEQPVLIAINAMRDDIKSLNARMDLTERAQAPPPPRERDPPRRENFQRRDNYSRRDNFTLTHTCFCNVRRTFRDS